MKKKLIGWNRQWGNKMVKHCWRKQEWVTRVIHEKCLNGLKWGREKRSIQYVEPTKLTLYVAQNSAGSHE